MGSPANKPGKWKNRHFAQSLHYALAGIATAWREERNFRFDCVMVGVVIITALVLHVTLSEWLWLLLAITLVVSAELWNTVIENIVDLTTHYKQHLLAKKAKDIAAGIVLLNTWFAVAVALIIFGRRILNLFL